MYYDVTFRAIIWNGFPPQMCVFCAYQNSKINITEVKKYAYIFKHDKTVITIVFLIPGRNFVIYISHDPLRKMENPS